MYFVLFFVCFFFLISIYKQINSQDSSKDSDEEDPFPANHSEHGELINTDSERRDDLGGPANSRPKRDIRKPERFKNMFMYHVFE